MGVGRSSRCLKSEQRHLCFTLWNPVKDFKQGSSRIRYVFQKDHCDCSIKNELEERKITLTERNGQCGSLNKGESESKDLSVFFPALSGKKQ